MYYFLVTVMILDGLLLGTVVLLQAGQGGGLASLGGGTTDWSSAVVRPSHLLTRTSWVCGGLFLFLALVLSLVSPNRGSSSEVQDRIRQRPRRSRRRPSLPLEAVPEPASARDAACDQLRPRPIPPTETHDPRIPTRGDRMTDRPAFVLLEDGTWFAGTTSPPARSRPSAKWSSPPT